MSETNNNVEEDADYEASSSDENKTSVDPPVVSQPPADILPSKNVKLLWSRSPHEWQGKLSVANVIKMVPGPTRYAVSHVQEIKSAFELFITPPVENNILEMINLEGCMADFDVTDLQASVQVYKSKEEATASLWNADTGRSIFPATMSLKTFHVLSFVIRFDDNEKRQGRRECDKLAAIRDVWDKCVQRLHFLYNSGPHITVNECLDPFHDCCPFKHNTCQANQPNMA